MAMQQFAAIVGLGYPNFHWYRVDHYYDELQKARSTVVKNFSLEKGSCTMTAFKWLVKDSPIESPWLRGTKTFGVR
ncbi:hypothetical protein, partial [Klebsiella pneumoniae]|uniref:hypothetical protein n=1 Tax=Klebsiella pneumoniae TaxID=573 RepID=UPI00272F07E5